MIDVRDLSKIYKSGKNEVQALNSVSFKLPDKGLVFIVGKSGSGKSTLLNMIGTLDDISSGEIYVDGVGLSSLNESETNAYRNSYLGIVYQNYNLFENETVQDNIKEGSDPLGIHYKDEEIEEVLKQVDLEGLRKKKVKFLSGGQKQRVAIARALIKKPKLILGDEPTGNLDSKTAKKLFTLFKEISKEKLVVIITHDNASAYEYGDRIIRLSDGEVVEDLIKNSKHSKLRDENYIYIDEESEISENEIEEINKNIEVSQRKIKKLQRKFIPYKDENIQEKVETDFENKKTNFKKVFRSGWRILLNNKGSVIVTSILAVLLISMLTLSTTFMNFKGQAAMNDVTRLYEATSIVMRKGYSLTNKVTEIEQDPLIEVSDSDILPLKEAGYKGNAYKIYNEPLIYTTYAPYYDHTGEIPCHASNFYEGSAFGTVVCDNDFLKKQFGEDYKVLAGSVYGIEETTNLIVPDYVADCFIYFNPEFTSETPTDPYERIINTLIFDRYVIGAVIDTNYEEKYSLLIETAHRLDDKTIDDTADVARRGSELWQKFTDDIFSRLNLTYSINPNYYEDYQYQVHHAFLPHTFVSMKEDYAPSELIAYPSDRYAYVISDFEGDDVAIEVGLYNSLFGTSISSSSSPEFEEKTIYLNNFSVDQDTTTTPKHQEKLVIKDVFTKKQGVGMGIKCSKGKLAKLSQYPCFAYGFLFDKVEEAHMLYDSLVSSFFFSPQTAIVAVFNAINVVNIFTGIFISIFWALVGVELLLIILHAFKTIKKEKYRFGVYKALGYSNSYLNVAILLSNIIMMLIIFGLSIATSFGLSFLANYLLQNGFYFYTQNLLYYQISLLIFRFDHVSLYSGITLVILLISSLIPLIKIRRIKPNNIIREAD